MPHSLMLRMRLYDERSVCPFHTIAAAASGPYHGEAMAEFSVTSTPHPLTARSINQTITMASYVPLPEAFYAADCAISLCDPHQNCARFWCKIIVIRQHFLSFEYYPYDLIRFYFLSHFGTPFAITSAYPVTYDSLSRGVFL